MQELLLDPELLEWVRSGKKTGTSRRGRRDIQLAPLKLVSNEAGSTAKPVCIGVKSVTYTRLRDIPQEVILSEGYADLDELIESLKRFYPDCRLEDEFTLVEW